MKLRNEEDILDIEFRKKVIEEILGPENMERKEYVKKSYDIFKDNTRKYVLKQLEKELSSESFEEAKHRASNLSIFRKIVDKKAMVYKDGASRVVVNEFGEPSEEGQEQIDLYVDKLNHNSKMKTVNRYTEGFRNTCAYIIPYPDPLSGKYLLKENILVPYLYDVIEDSENPELPRVFILSSFNPNKNGQKVNKAPGSAGQRNKRSSEYVKGDGLDQIIADSPDDFGTGEDQFIFWSNKYHFTCNEAGEIISSKSPDDLLNPIQMLPFVNFAKNQDGQFWALGADDLIDGSILVNMMLTDLYFIAKMQSMGIFYLIGKGIPKTLKIGPSDAIILEKKEGDPDAQIGFASSNPPISDYMKMVEQYIALLLSTNNLEPGTVQGELSAAGAASGIQEMIRMSENIEDIEDQREQYRDNEPVIYKIITKWHNLFFEKGLLDDELQMLGRIDENNKLKVKFNDSKRYFTEKDKLDIIEKRRSLGIDTMIDSLMFDNPDLSRIEAENKLKEILQEKLESRKLMMTMDFDNGDESNEEDQSE